MEQVLSEFRDIKLNLPALPANFIKVEFVDEDFGDEDNDVHLQSSTVLPFAATKVFTSTIVSSEKLAEGEDIKTVYRIFLDNSKIQHQFVPGDTIGILTTNFRDEVQFVLDQMEANDDADNLFVIKLQENLTKKSSKLPVYLPKYGTYRSLLRQVLDLRNIPKKLFLRSLIDYTSDAIEKRFLKIMCSKEGTIHYRNLILDKEVTFLGILRMLKTCKPPFTLLLEHLPRLMPRPYSIINSHLVNDKEIGIVFSIFSESNKKGLTTSFLENAILADNKQKIPFYFRNRNAFNFSEVDVTDFNQILIGVGTAIAPYLGFLELKKKCQSSSEKGKTWLFSGSRYERNQLFRDEFQKHLVDKNLDRIFEAFSREPNGKHVQDLIVENKSELLEFLMIEKMRLYVCGSPKMVEDIQAIFEKFLAETTSIEDAKKTIIAWKKSNKYVEDVWH